MRHVVGLRLSCKISSQFSSAGRARQWQKLKTRAGNDCCKMAFAETHEKCAIAWNRVESMSEMMWTIVNNDVNLSMFHFIAWDLIAGGYINTTFAFHAGFAQRCYCSVYVLVLSDTSGTSYKKDRLNHHMLRKVGNTFSILTNRKPHHEVFRLNV